MKSGFQICSSLEEGLNGGHFLESVALLDGGDWLKDGEAHGSSWAVLALGTGEVVADVFEETRSNSVLNLVIVDSVGNDPWDVGVRWGKRLSLEGNGVLILDGILTFVATHDSIDVGNVGLGSALGGNTLVAGGGVLCLNAVDEMLSHHWA